MNSLLENEDFIELSEDEKENVFGGEGPNNLGIAAVDAGSHCIPFTPHQHGNNWGRRGC